MRNELFLFKLSNGSKLNILGNTVRDTSLALRSNLKIRDELSKAEWNSEGTILKIMQSSRSNIKKMRGRKSSHQKLINNYKNDNKSSTTAINVGQCALSIFFRNILK